MAEEKIFLLSLNFRSTPALPDSSRIRTQGLALAGMIAGKQVVVIGEGKDRYQRVIGWISHGKLDVNREMVRQGWAWHYVRYTKIRV